MIIYDSPIIKSSNDKLNRRNFAEKLSTALCETDLSIGLNVAIYGPWGSGKSSVINMIVNSIKDNYREKIIIVNFNPWYYSSTGQLIQLFFESLSKQIANSKHEAINELANAFDDFAAIAGVFSDKAKTALEFVKKKINEENPLDATDIMAQHLKIENILKTIDFKIIVVMDDIDRLPDNDIKMIFQLITAVARFPNIIYLLAFDKDIVSKALNNMQGYNGERYLEKIIQVPVQLPEIRTVDIWTFLEEGMNKLHKSYPTMIVDEKHLWQILSLCVPRYINNLRDIIRLFNALEIKMRMIGDDINFPDLLGITIIENKIPDLYRWIKNNRVLLVDSLISDIAFQAYEITEIHQMYLKIISKFREDDPEDILALLSCLFPIVDKRCNISPIHDVDMYGLRRIGCEKTFDRYFVLDIGSDEWSRKDVRQVLELETTNCLPEFFCELKQQGKLLDFLLEINENSLSKERISAILDALLDNYTLFITEPSDINKLTPFKPKSEILFYHKCNALINSIADSYRRKKLTEITDELLGTPQPRD